MSAYKRKDALFDPRAQAIADLVLSYFGLEEFSRSKAGSQARAVTAYLITHHLGFSCAKTANYLGDVGVQSSLMAVRRCEGSPEMMEIAQSFHHECRGLAAPLTELCATEGCNKDAVKDGWCGPCGREMRLFGAIRDPKTITLGIRGQRPMGDFESAPSIARRGEHEMRKARKKTMHRCAKPGCLKIVKLRYKWCFEHNPRKEKVLQDQEDINQAIVNTGKRRET